MVVVVVVVGRVTCWVNEWVLACMNHGYDGAQSGVTVCWCCSRKCRQGQRRARRWL